MIGGIQEVLVEGRNQALGQWIGRTSLQPHAQFSRIRMTDGSDLVGQVSPRAGDARRTQLVGGRERNCGVIRTGGEAARKWKSK